MTAQRSSWGSNRPAARKGHRVLRYWADTHDGTGYRRHCETVRGTKRDGDRRLAELRVAHADDRPVPTLAQVYGRRWLADAEDRVAEGSMTRTCLKQQQSAWGVHVSPAFGDVPVPDIRPADVQDWLLTMSASSAKASLTLLQQVITMAVKFDEVESRALGVKYRMPRGGGKRDSGIWTLAELLEMWGLLCRVGESLAVLGEDVRPYAVDGAVYAIVPIVREMDNRTRFPVDRLKNEQSRRDVVVPPPMSSALLGRAGWLSDRPRHRRPDHPAAAARHLAARVRAHRLRPPPVQEPPQLVADVDGHERRAVRDRGEDDGPRRNDRHGRALPEANRRAVRRRAAPRRDRQARGRMAGSWVKLGKVPFMQAVYLRFC